MYKVGISTCGNKPMTDEAFKAMADSNISAVEISLPYNKVKDFDYKNAKTLSDRYGVDIWSYHLPFLPFEEIDPSHLDKEIRSYTVKYFSELIKKGADIGIDKFVIHPSGEPIDDSEREERMKCSMDSLDKLAEAAHECGAVIAVEDLPRSCLGHDSDEILRLISANDKLRVCFDTNHLLIDDNITFMDKLGDKIVTIHVSDYEFIDECHWLPGEGKVDWVKMIDKFEEIKYNGVWLYEMGFKGERGITRSRDLTYKDFYDNAKAIFERCEIPRI